MARSMEQLKSLGIISLVVIVGLVGVNYWLGKEVARVNREAEVPTAVPASVRIEPTSQVAKIPVIDPLSDPLAPMPARKTAFSEPAAVQESPSKALPVYESPQTSPIFAQ